MKKLMTIEDIRNVPGKGVVVGGINPTLDHLTAEDIEKKIGEYVEIRSSSPEIIKKFSVLDVKIAESIVGKKNIFILLSEDFDMSHGAEIFFE
jgi:RecA-family ATPase